MLPGHGCPGNPSMSGTQRAVPSCSKMQDKSCWQSPCPYCLGCGGGCRRFPSPSTMPVQSSRLGCGNLCFRLGNSAPGSLHPRAKVIFWVTDLMQCALDWKCGARGIELSGLLFLFKSLLFSQLGCRNHWDPAWVHFSIDPNRCAIPW